MRTKKTALDVLNENKIHSFEHAKNISEIPYKFQSRKILEHELFESLKTKNFTKAIENLSRLRDLRSNINSHISEDLGNGTRSLVRDAREAIDTPVIAPESYEMMCANHARAAIILLENSFNRDEIDANKLKEAKEKIQESAALLINTAYLSLKDKEEEFSIDKQNDQSDENSLISKLENKIKEFDHSLNSILKNAGIKDVQNKIKVTIEFANLEDEHLHISTISKIKDTKIIEIENMNLGLTDLQREMFENVKKATLVNGKMQSDEKNMEWFNLQPLWKQDLIIKYTDDILSEKKLIPTQLRNELPLLRNSYTKTIYTKKPLEQEFTEVLLTSHSGTLTTNIPSKPVKGFINRIKEYFNREKIIKSLANITIEQMKMFSSNGEIHLNLQTSPNNPLEIVDIADNKFIKQSEGVFRSITAYNGVFRRLPGGGRDLAGSKLILANIAAKLENEDNGKYKNVGLYLKGSLSYKKMGEFDKNTNIGKALNLLVEAKKTADSVSFIKIRDSEHVNSQISEKIALGLYSLNKLKPEWKLPITNISCASGKDRTQMLMAGLSSRAISKETGLKESDICLMLSRSGNTQYLSGSNGGGTVGCHGQKTGIFNSSNYNIFKDSYKYIGQRTSYMNKFHIPDTNFKKMIQIITHPINAYKKYILNIKKDDIFSKTIPMDYSPTNIQQNNLDAIKHLESVKAIKQIELSTDSSRKINHTANMSKQNHLLRTN